MTIFLFALKRSFRNKFTLVALCIIPLILVFIRPLWQPDTAMGFSLYGMILMYTAFLLMRAIMTDRLSGAVVRIFAAPVTTFQYLLQNLMAYALLLMAQIMMFMVLGGILYQWQILFMLQLFLCYTIFAGTSIGFSLSWHSFFRSKEMSDAVFGVVASLINIIGGIFVPIAMLPVVLQKIGMILPTYWLSKALLVVLENGPAGSYFLSIAALILFTMAFLIFGSKRRLE